MIDRLIGRKERRSPKVAAIRSAWLAFALILLLIGLRPLLSRANPPAKPWFSVLYEIDRRSGQAAGVFDLNRDGWEDIVIVSGSQYHVATNNLGQRKRASTPFSVRSESIDPPQRPFTRRSAKGLGLHDFDNDGLLDIYLAQIGQNNPAPCADFPSAPPFDASYSVRESQGNGQFVAIDLGNNSSGTVRSVIFGDFDGDGFFDSYHSVAPYWMNETSGNQLLRLNPATKKYQNVIDSVLVPPNPSFWHDELGRGNKGFKGNVIRDLDKDGKPDIVTGAYADLAPWTEGTCIPTDYQGKWDRGLFLLRNMSQPGTIRFEDVSNQAISFANPREKAYSNGLTSPQMHVYSAIPADIDGDGDLDLFVTGPRNRTAHRSLEDNTPIARVYRNDSRPGNLTFVEITQEAGIDFLNDGRIESVYPPYARRKVPPNLAAGTAFDIDNDGDIDFVHIDRSSFQASKTPFLWLNDGTGHFSLVKPSVHGLVGVARDLSYGDFNQDGRLDLVTVDGSIGGHQGSNRNTVYLNQIRNHNHFIKLKVSWPNNPLGIGAKVTLYQPGTTRIVGYDEVRTDFCYRSKRSTTLHFGLGQMTVVDAKVTRSNGQSSWFKGLKADNTHTLS
jgi:hypothetical protein